MSEHLDVNLSDFILKVPTAFSSDWCKKVIDYYDNMSKLGFCRNRQKVEGIPKHLKDTEMFNTTRFVSAKTELLDTPHKGLAFNGVPAIQEDFNKTVWYWYDIYRYKYSCLQTDSWAPQDMYEMKIQKTEIGEGFHTWHYEQVGRDGCSRFMNVQVFLNNVDEGGETEFLYLNRIEKPVEGTLLIYPGNY